MCRTTVTGSLAVWLPINRTPPPTTLTHTECRCLYQLLIDFGPRQIPAWTTARSIPHSKEWLFVAAIKCLIFWSEYKNSNHYTQCIFGSLPLAAIWHIAKTSIDLTSVQQFRKPNKEMGNILN